MKSHPTRLIRAVALLATTAALSGCFGGGDDDTPPAADPLASVPDSATQSVSGLVAYLVSLLANSSDTREPIDITALSLPTSDNTEPDVVN